MRLLLDTNVLIALEPVTDELEPTFPVAAQLHALVSRGGHALLLHPAHRHDLSRGERGRRRAPLAAKFPELVAPPGIPAELERIVGSTEPGSNDWVDHVLLAAVWADAVDFLVTEDVGLHRKAERAGLQDRVATIAGAVGILRGLFDEAPTPPPAVLHLLAHQLDSGDPIFDSLRVEYGPSQFDAWLSRAKRDQRDCWVITATGSRYAAVCIVKRETEAYGLSGKVLKISTLKVAEEHRGRHYGELMLKTVFGHASRNRFEHLYLTVFDHHADLITLLEDFGFAVHTRSDRGELVMAKRRVETVTDRELDPLSFHVALGPPALHSLTSQTYVVPVQPRFHSALFPDAEDPNVPAQLTLRLDPDDQPYGNSLRKAYLCRSPMRRLPTGATLLFYRSHDLRAITTVGVLERAVASDDADTIARLVGKRTVYSYRAIDSMAATGEVLVLMFRQDRLIEAPLHLSDLIEQRLLNGPPQSVTTVREEGLTWLARRLGV